nr:uncharacterized protein LOC121470889 [Taeniopygia guttata]
MGRRERRACAVHARDGGVGGNRIAARPPPQRAGPPRAAIGWRCASALSITQWGDTRGGGGFQAPPRTPRCGPGRASGIKERRAGTGSGSYRTVPYRTAGAHRAAPPYRSVPYRTVPPGHTGQRLRTVPYRRGTGSAAAPPGYTEHGPRAAPPHRSVPHRRGTPGTERSAGGRAAEGSGQQGGNCGLRSITAGDSLRGTTIELVGSGRGPQGPSSTAWTQLHTPGHTDTARGQTDKDSREQAAAPRGTARHRRCCGCGTELCLGTRQGTRKDTGWHRTPNLHILLRGCPWVPAHVGKAGKGPLVMDYPSVGNWCQTGAWCGHRCAGTRCADPGVCRPRCVQTPVCGYTVCRPRWSRRAGQELPD